MVQGPGGHGNSSMQFTRVHSIDDCVVLGKCSRGLQRLKGLLGSLAAPSGTAARDHGRQQWLPEPSVYTHLAAGASYSYVPVS